MTTYQKQRHHFSGRVRWVNTAWPAYRSKTNTKWVLTIIVTFHLHCTTYKFQWTYFNTYTFCDILYLPLFKRNQHAFSDCITLWYGGKFVWLYIFFEMISQRKKPQCLTGKLTLMVNNKTVSFSKFQTLI